MSSPFMRRDFGWFGTLLVIAGSAIAPLRAQAPLVDATIATLSTALAPIGIAASPDGRLLYVAELEPRPPIGPDTGCFIAGAPGSALTHGQVEIFDTVARTRVAVTDAVPGSAGHVALSTAAAAVDPFRRITYGARAGSPDIQVIDAETGALLRTMPTGLVAGIGFTSIDPARRRLYVAGTGAAEVVNSQVVHQRVRVIDLATEQMVRDIVLANIHAVRVDPATGRLWVLSSEAGVIPSAYFHAVVFDPDTLAEAARIPVGRCASGLVFDTVRHLAYVTSELDRSISVIDMAKVPSRSRPLPAPTDLRAVVSGARVSFTWSSIPRAASYDLEVGSQQDATDLVVLNTTGLGVTATLPRGTYYVRVRAKLAGGTASDPSNEVAVTMAAINWQPLISAGADIPKPSGFPTQQAETVVRPRDIEPCGYSVAPATAMVGAASSAVTFAVNDALGSACEWAAAAALDSEFLTVTSGASGAGNGSVTATIAPLDGDPRIGTVVIDGRAVTVMQCAQVVTPTSASLDAIGGAVSLAVTTLGGCDWTVASDSPFLTLTSGTFGSGDGTAIITAAQNTGAARSGTVTIAGQSVTISQAGAGGQCAFGVTPGSATAPAGGGAMVFTITTQTACSWTAASTADFLAITGAAAGTGSGSVMVTASSNPGAVRSATVAIAGQIVNVTQDAVGFPSCVLSVAPTNASVSASSGTFMLTVNTTQGAGCNWTAATNSSFLTIAGDPAGVDSVPVAVAVSQNTGSVRSGTLNVAGRTVTLTQDGIPTPSCAYAVTPTNEHALYGGGLKTFVVSVTQGANCAWTAVSNSGFLSIASMPPMTGGAVVVTVPPNTRTARAGTLTIAGENITINQDQAPCAFDVTPSTNTVPATGGTRTFTVTKTQGESCGWTAASNSGFLMITSGGSGIGSGSVAVTASANTGAARPGTLTIAGRTISVTQDQAAGCAFEISPATFTITQASGASRTIAVTNTQGPSCGWTAVSNNNFLSITNGSSGTGSGTVTVQVASTGVQRRQGTLTVAGRTVTVIQEGTPCTFDVTPETASVPGTGGTATLRVVNAQGNDCGWTAASNSSFLTVSAGSSGTGSGSVTVSVAANSGSARTGSLTIADEVVTIIQDAFGCALEVSPLATNVPASGATSAFSVTSTSGSNCGWTAVSNDSFLAVANGSSGSGSGSVSVTSTANNGAARSGTLTIADRTIKVTQEAAADCAFDVSPRTPAVASIATTLTFTVTSTSGANCGWTAVSNAAFMTVTNGSSGTGSGAVAVVVAAYTGTSQRAGTLSIAGVSVSVRQDSPTLACRLTVSPTTMGVAAGGGTKTITVTNIEGSNCNWTAVSNSSFVTVSSGSSGTGSGTVTLTVPVNSSTSRSGTVTVAGQTVTLNQDGVGTCAFSVDPMNITVTQASGGTRTINVTNTQGTSCNWTAVSNSDFLTITGGSSGTGSGVVTVQVADTGVQVRQGTLTVAGRTVVIVQEGAPCTFDVLPETVSMSGSGGSTTFNVRNAQGTNCGWTAASNASFLSVSSGSSGSGSGSVTVTVAANSGAARTGTLTIADEIVTIVQDAIGCAIEVSPTTTLIPASGATSTFTVTSTQGTNCGWTAVSNDSFLTIAGGSSGTGSGTVTVMVAANSGAARPGTLTIAGRTVTINQAAGATCAFDVSPRTPAIPSTATTMTFTVTNTSGTNCGWTAVSNATFMAITSGSSGTGSGSVTVAIAAYAGTSQRAGTLSIAGVSVSVRQDSPILPCRFTVSPTTTSTAASGGTRIITVTNTEGTNCSWTAVSNNGFLTVASGSSGTGSGSVTITVPANNSTSRSGTLTIAGVNVTVSQDGAAACSFTVDPTRIVVKQASGGTRTISVTNTQGTNYNWTAVSNSGFLTITGGSSGAGSGTVTVQVADTGVQVRQGTLTVAGQTVVIVQEGAPCTFDVDPQTATIAGGGGAKTFKVINGQGTNCGWTAVSNSSFLTVSSGSSGSGSGSVTVTVANNSGGTRAGTLTIADEVITIVQDAAACTLDVSPTNTTISTGGGAQTISVTQTQGSGCTWTAVSNSGFLTVTSGSSGTGSGSVVVTASANTGAARPGTLTVAGRTVTVTQNAAAACVFDVSPRLPAVPSTAGTMTFTVTNTSGTNCSRTAVSNAPFMTVTSGSSGTGSGSVTVAIAAHTGTSQRAGTLAIAGVTVTVRQDPPP